METPVITVENVSQEELAALVRKHLQQASHAGSAMVAPSEVNELAQRIAQVSDGSFFRATMVTDALLSGADLTAMPVSLGESIDRRLESLGADRTAVVSLLRILADHVGGLTLDEWFSAAHGDSGHPDRAEFARAVDSARDLLTTDLRREDGQEVYRLVHQSLVDYFLQR